MVRIIKAFLGVHFLTNHHRNAYYFGSYNKVLIDGSYLNRIILSTMKNIFFFKKSYFFLLLMLVKKWPDFWLQSFWQAVNIWQATDKNIFYSIWSKTPCSLHYLSVIGKDVKKKDFSGGGELNSAQWTINFF